MEKPHRRYTGVRGSPLCPADLVDGEGGGADRYRAGRSGGAGGRLVTGPGERTGWSGTGTRQARNRRQQYIRTFSHQSVALITKDYEARSG